MAVITVEIYVPNLATVLGLFDEMQVFRSENGESGDYSEITADGSEAATILGTETGPFTLDTLTLTVKVDGGLEQTMTFATADPIAIDDVVDAINDELTGVTATEESGALRLTSDTTGTSSIVEITGGTSPTELGLSVELVSGKEDRITLVAGTTTYTFVDESGDVTYFYKTRFYNSVTENVSSFSDPMEGDLSSIISSAELVKCSATFADVNGVPLAGKRVSFQNVYSPPYLVVENVGVIGQSIEVESDVLGYLETMLVKGATIDVAIAGTAIVRRITVPDADFDLFSAIATADDVFQIQEIDIPDAPRRS